MNAKDRALVKMHFTRFLKESEGAPSPDMIVEKIIEVSDRYRLTETEVSDFLMKEGAFMNLLSKFMNMSGDKLSKAGDISQKVLAAAGNEAKKLGASLAPDQQKEFVAAFQKISNTITAYNKNLNAMVDGLPHIDDGVKAQMRMKINAALPAALGDVVKTAASALPTKPAAAPKDVNTAVQQTFADLKQKNPQQAKAAATDYQQCVKAGGDTASCAEKILKFAPKKTAATPAPAAAQPQKMAAGMSGPKEISNATGKSVLNESAIPEVDPISRKISGIPE